MSRADQESAKLEEAIEGYASGETSFENCSVIYDSLSSLFGIEGIDEELALKKGIEIAAPFFEKVIKGEVPSPSDPEAGAALSRALSILAVFHCIIGGRFKRMACIDVVSQCAGLEGAVPVFSWVGPSKARLDAFVPEHADKAIVAFRGRGVLSHELLLCTDYRLKRDGRIRLWIEKRRLLPKKEGLTLDEAMCVAHAIYFGGLHEKLRKLEQSLCSLCASLDDTCSADAL